LQILTLKQQPFFPFSGRPTFDLPSIFWFRPCTAYQSGRLLAASRVSLAKDSDALCNYLRHTTSKLISCLFVRPALYFTASDEARLNLRWRSHQDLLMVIFIIISGT
jgi:hypothetical protein